MKKFKNIKLMLLSALVALGSVNAWADDGYDKLFKFTHNGSEATITGFNTDLTKSDKASIEIPATVTDVVTKKSLKVVGIAAEAFKKEADLTTIDLSKATNLASIGASAFEGTKIASLDMSKTKVTVVENMFGTGYSVVVEEEIGKTEANKRNVDELDRVGGTIVKDGPVEGSGVAFGSWAAINQYYRELYGERAMLNGDTPPCTTEEAAAINAGIYSLPFTTATPKEWGIEEALEWNVANVPGAFNAGDVLTETTVTLYKNATGVTKPVGYVLTAADAQNYNEKKFPAVARKATDQRYHLDEDGVTKIYENYTAEEVQAYCEENIANCTKAGDVNPYATPFATAKDARDWNIAHLPEFLTEEEKASFAVYGIDDIKPGSETVISNAYETNLATLEGLALTDESIVVSYASQKEEKTIPAKGKNTTLTTVVLPAAWETISYGAFEACEGLTSISLGGNPAKKPISVGDRALLGTKITALDFSATLVTSIPSDLIVNVIEDPFKLDKKYVNVKDNATLASVTFNTLISSIPAYVFYNCKALKEVKFPTDAEYTAAENAFGYVGVGAFGNTIIEAITIPSSLSASVVDGIDEAAFYGCEKLKTFTYKPELTVSAFVVNDLAFPGCKGVKYVTTNENVKFYMLADVKAPRNTSFEISGNGSVLEFKVEPFKDREGKYYVKYMAYNDISVKKSECKVYDAYRDDVTYGLNMMAYKTSGEYYNIAAGDVVLIITDKADLTYDKQYGGAPSGSNVGTMDNALEIVTDKDGYERALLDWIAASYTDPSQGVIGVVYGWVSSATKGTGFMQITSGSVFPFGSMYALAAVPEADGARGNVRWFDENGFEESDPTAIEAIKNIENENGAVFNLQGVRVNNALKKGIYIQNGKKLVK
jgi:hypothetical protein